MLVKSKKEDHHLDNLWETFETLCLYDMKFNPSKCVLGVSLVKFLASSCPKGVSRPTLTKFKPYWR